MLNFSKQKMHRRFFKSKNPYNSFLVEELYNLSKSIDSKIKFSYKNAAKAIANYILPIKSSEDAKLLKGVGKHILSRIDSILKNNIKNIKKSLEIRNKIPNKILSPIKVGNRIEKKSEKSVFKASFMQKKHSGQKDNQKRSGNGKNTKVKDTKKLKSSMERREIVFDENFHQLVLLIDSREKEEDKTSIKKKLSAILGESNVEIRSLSLGDLVWIVKDKRNNEEFLMDVIIERKRVSDLEKSVRDSRYNEQKYRLENCGLDRVIYLIEGNIENSHIKQSLKSAIATTECINGFLVYRSENAFETSELTLNVTLNLLEKINHLQGEKLKLFCFEEFSSQMRKQTDQTESEIFTKQLSCIDSVGHEKALAISQKFKNPGAFYRALKKMGEEEAIGVVSGIVYGKTKRRIGVGPAKSVFNFFVKSK